MEFYKFPRTPHLLTVAVQDVRDDKVMEEADVSAFLSGEVIVEEKVDGANVGISFEESGEMKFQNRGNFITPDSHPQFDTLRDWGYRRFEALQTTLSDRYILFGEWCRLQHSIRYTKLPDWFLGFDVFDVTAQRFLAVEARNAILSKCQVETVPILFRGKTTQSELLEMLDWPSRIYDGALEGLYLRTEEQGYLKQRAKIVRPGFMQTIEQHWTRKKTLENRCIGGEGRSLFEQI
jgi:ATP-dependent RNA circularization protein (DNA/RNA ligase family)